MTRRQMIRALEPSYFCMWGDVLLLGEKERVIIRRATGADAKAIWTITRRAYAQYADSIRPTFGALRIKRHTLQEQIITERWVYALAFCRGEPSGTIRYRIWPTHIALSRLAVDPNCQCFGMGKKLLQWAEEEARVLNINVIRGEVRTALPRLQAYYRRMGYRPRGYRSGSGYRRYLTVMEKSI